MQNEIQKEEPEIVVQLTLKENIEILASMAFFFAIWIALVVFLPIEITLGYFVVMAAAVAILWLYPRNEKVKSDPNFFKVN